MQYGILKYDEWDDLLWVYNSIHSPIRTSLTGSLIAIKREDESIKYTHFISDDRDPYRIADSYNFYCGCFDNSLNSLSVYEEHLLVAKPKDLFVVSKDGERVLNILSQGSQFEITYGHTRHISCCLFPTTCNNLTFALSNNYNELFFVDSTTGKVKSKLSAQLENTTMGYQDMISTISDFMSNQSNSSCLSSYQLEYANDQSSDYTNLYKNSTSEGGDKAADNSAENKDSNDSKKSGFSFKSVAEKYGGVESIPEFVPSSFSASNSTNLNTQQNTNFNPYTNNSSFPTHQNAQGVNFEQNNAYMDRTIGSLSLEYILNDLKPSNLLQNEFVNTTCIGTSSGLLHLVDNKSNKIVSSVNSHNNPVYSISASNTTIATTSCTVYSYQNSYPYRNHYSYNSNPIRLFEPVVCLHDIRMMKSYSMVLGKPVSKVFIVPKSDRLFALSPDGDIFDCTISTLEYTKVAKKPSSSTCYYDLSVFGESKGDTLNLFMSDSAYSVEGCKVENELKHDLDYNNSKLAPNLREIPKSQSREYNNTPFASLVPTFDGDVAHMFVIMFFFLPKLPSMKYHVCEISHCIACQIGFGLHNLQKYYDNKVNKQGLNHKNEVKKYSNNILYATQLQELMLIENQPNLRTPLNLLVWLLEKINTELDNYYNKNRLTVTSSLINDLFSFSKKSSVKCLNFNHINTVITNHNHYIPYEDILNSSSNPYFTVDTRCVEYCKGCNNLVECDVNVEYLNTPNLLLVDFSTSKTDKINPVLLFNGSKYQLSCFYFTLPPDNLYYRPLMYVKLPSQYRVSYSLMTLFQVNENEWILVNDGIVMYSDESEEDMFNFDKNWKLLLFAIYIKDFSTPGSVNEMEKISEIIPCINDENNIISIKNRLVPLPYPTLKIPIPAYIFLDEHNIAHNPLAHNKLKSFTPISLEELNDIQNSNFTFALDIEYIKSNLKTSTHNSFNLSESSNAKSSFILTEDDSKYLFTLARVTAIRGNDNKFFSVPFFDHYILNNKPPKDYNTRFSGIHYGDLELKSSVHWLTTEKMIYLKLRYLIDNGCKIIGHGLEQDLRILNLCVPDENIIDTLELFWIPGKRYMSLQFLSFYLLNKKIQVNEHNSIEDATTSLLLYRLYKDYKSSNKLEEVTNNLYNIGYKTNWTIE